MSRLNLLIRKAFPLLFVGIFLFLFLGSSVLAQEKSMMMETTASAKIDYNLAFPGMLPDNPLYKLKVLRDKLSAILINDPYKRTEFYLLQADKGILAAAILVDKNKIDLAGKTALKAENNITLLANEFYRFVQKPEPAFFNKLKTASLKHQEVLNSLIQRVPENERQAFKDVLYFSKSNLRTIEKFQNKKFFKI